MTLLRAVYKTTIALYYYTIFLEWHGGRKAIQSLLQEEPATEAAHWTLQ